MFISQPIEFTFEKANIPTSKVNVFYASFMLDRLGMLDSLIQLMTFFLCVFSFR